MNAHALADIANAPRDVRADADAQIALLKAAGADRFDAVRLRYIEVLVRRFAVQPEGIRRILEARLTRELALFSERFGAARDEACETIERSIKQHPYAADELKRLFAAGDFKGLHRLAGNLNAGDKDVSFMALVRDLEAHAPDHVEVRPAVPPGPHAELKTIRRFRKTWSTMSVHQQVSRAMEQAPRNAGPINSHMLMLRSLATMRDISPDYLNRFISYADALLCLDRSDKPVAAAPQKKRATKPPRK